MISYFNPIIALGAEKLDAAGLQKAVRAKMQAFDLAENAELELAGQQRRKSDFMLFAAFLAEEKKAYYWRVLATDLRSLDDFLATGSLRFFEDFKPNILFSDIDFLNFIAPYYAHQYKLAIISAYQLATATALKTVLRGYSLLLSANYEQALGNTNDWLTSQVKEMAAVFSRLEVEGGKTVAAAVQALVNIENLNALPAYFQARRDDIGHGFCTVGVAIYNREKDAALSWALLSAANEVKTSGRVSAHIQKNYAALKPLANVELSQKSSDFAAILAKVMRQESAIQEQTEAEKARVEAEAKAKKEKEARELAEKIAAEKARVEADAKAKKEKLARELAEKLAAEKARVEADAKAKKEKEARELAEKLAAEKARVEADAKAKKEKEARELAEKLAAEKARIEADAKAKKEKEARELAEKIAAEKVRVEAETKAKKEKEARELAEKLAAEKARVEADAKAKKEKEARELAEKLAAEKARVEADAKAKKEKEARELAEKLAAEKARVEADAKAKKEKEARELAEKLAAEKARIEADAKAKKEKEARELAEKIAAEKVRVEAETKAKKEKEARELAEKLAAEKARVEADAKAKKEKEARELAEKLAAEKARVEADAKAKKEKEARELAEKIAAEKARVEADAKAKKEKEARELAEKLAAAELAAEKARVEAEAKAEAQKSALAAKISKEKAEAKAEAEKADALAADPAWQEKQKQKRRRIGIFIALGLTAALLAVFINKCNNKENNPIQNLAQNTDTVAQKTTTNVDTTKKATPIINNPPTNETLNFEFEMVLVQGGSFNMGCNSSSDCNANFYKESPAHKVSLSSFYIAKYELSQKEWREIMGSNPSSFKNCDDCPVENISWNDAQQFIKKLNQKTGKNYRLPTEAEWEFAARGGNKSKNYKYAGSDKPAAVGWLAANKTYPRGQKAANELGLYDMTGNVFEFCADFYAEDYYLNSPSQNPQGPKNGVQRVARGSSFIKNEKFSFLADRDYTTPSSKANYQGFRLTYTP